MEKWMGENTPFPHRDAGEFDYELSDKYNYVFDEIQEFARNLIKDSESQGRKKRINYWSALALMRGVISSPSAGVDMLNNRLKKLDSDETDGKVVVEENPILDQAFGFENEFASGQLIETEDWTEIRTKNC